VRALTDSGTLLATNTVTATVGTTSPSSPPPSSTGTLTQTIANGSTLSGSVSWRAVYDKNSDKIPDDPGAVRFLVDGKTVLTEQTMPFGDTTGFWSSDSVSDGRHTFEVHALNSSGTVVATNTVSASVQHDAPPPSGTTTPPATPTDTTAPSTPGNLRVTAATATSVTVAWNASTDNVGVTGYDVYRATTKVGTTTSTGYTITGLTCGTAYSVAVKALDQAGNTSPQATMSATTSACADSQPPTAPGNVTASTRTTTSIALTWAAATDNVGVAGYGIYNAGSLVNTTVGTTGIVSGLSCGTNYTLSVDAFDASGNSSPKTTVMVSTLACADTSPPTQPTNLRATSTTTTSIALAWNPSTDNVGVTGYDVYRATTKVGTTTSTSYTITALTCGTAYTIGVKALDNANNASPQATLTITTPPCAVQAPAAVGSYPNASNTGVPAGTTLTPIGNTTITTNNAVIDAVSTSGCLDIRGE
jgi:chitodextrinase